MEYEFLPVDRLQIFIGGSAPQFLSAPP
jgi:hypothetical protein